MIDANAQLPVEVLQPANPDVVTQVRQKQAIAWPLLILGSAAVLLLSIFLLRSASNYQEIFNLMLAHNSRLFNIYSFTSPDDPMPLYYAFIHFIAGEVGLSLLGLRLFSFACFVLMLPLAYATGVRATDDRRVGLFAMVLTGISPFMVWYASRATMYALLALIVLANMYFFVGILRRRDWSWPGYILTGLLGLGVHYFFAVAVLTQLLFFVVERRKFSTLSKFVMPVVGILLAAAFGYWIYHSALHTTSWLRLPYTAKPSATNVFIIFEQFLFGFQSVETITFVIALWPLLVILGLLAVQKYVRPTTSVRYFILAASVPVVALFALGWIWRPLFLSSYFIVCLPPFVLAVAWYLATFELPVLVLARNILLVVMLIMLVIEAANVHRAITGDYLGITSPSAELLTNNSG